MINDKALFRKQALSKRESLSRDEVAEKSNAIIKKLVNYEVFRDSRNIMSYVSFRNEVITTDLISLCLESGKSVSVPALVEENDVKSIKPVKIRNLTSDLKVSSFGILEPSDPWSNIVDARELDLVIVPGVAFDECKNRMGFGRGYYDKFFHESFSGSVVKIALAYELQLYPEIPAGPYDVPMDFIFTEDRII